MGEVPFFIPLASKAAPEVLVPPPDQEAGTYRQKGTH